jgi:hypothetical protein
MATYLTLEQCRELLGGVAKSTLAEWRADGRFPRGKLLPNGRVLISVSQLDAFLESLVSA